MGHAADARRSPRRHRHRPRRRARPSCRAASRARSGGSPPIVFAGGPHRRDVLAHVAERLAGLDAEPFDDGAVRDPDPESEPSVSDLVEIARGGGECHRMLQVDRLDRRAELDRRRRVRDRQAQPERVAEARTVDAGEAAAARSRSASSTVRARRPGTAASDRAGMRSVMYRTYASRGVASASVELVAADLAGGRPREFVDEVHVARCLVASEVVGDQSAARPWPTGVRRRPSRRRRARRWPNSGSSTPTTATSSMPGWASSRSSTSRGKTFSPPLTIMSSARPVTNSSPSSVR